MLKSLVLFLLETSTDSVCTFVNWKSDILPGEMYRIINGSKVARVRFGTGTTKPRCWIGHRPPKTHLVGAGTRALKQKMAGYQLGNIEARCEIILMFYSWHPEEEICKVKRFDDMGFCDLQLLNKTYPACGMLWLTDASSISTTKPGPPTVYGLAVFHH